MKVKSLKMLAIVALVTMTMQNVYAYDVDVIITKSREQIQCNIVSQDDEYVTYNSVDANNKDIYKIPRSEIEKIYMRTGDVVTFTAAKPIEAATHPTEQLITDKPVQPQMDKPATQEVEKPAPQDKKVEPAKQEAEKKENTDKKANNSTKTQPPFKFSGVIKGYIDLPETNKEKKQDTKIDYHKDLLLFVIGLPETLQGTQQIIENELTGKLASITGNVVTYPYDSLIANETDEQLLDIARNRKAEKICIFRVIPYQDEYYLTARLINSADAQVQAHSSTSSSLSNLSEIISVTGHISSELDNQIKVQKEQQRKDETKAEEIVDFEIVGTNNPFIYRFNNLSSGATDFRWDFGDGMFSFAKDYALHSYEAAGTYTITLTANVGSQKYKQQKTFTVGESSRQAQEEEELQELMDASLEQLQQSTGNLIQTIQNMNAVENTFALDIVNRKNFPCKVVVAGQQIGIVKPMTKERFLVSTDLHGQVKLIQASGYALYPTIAEYIIPKQQKRAVVTLAMD